MVSTSTAPPAQTTSRDARAGIVFSVARTEAEARRRTQFFISDTMPVALAAIVQRVLGDIIVAAGEHCDKQHMTRRNLMLGIRNSRSHADYFGTTSFVGEGVVEHESVSQIADPRARQLAAAAKRRKAAVARALAASEAKLAKAVPKAKVKAKAAPKSKSKAKFEAEAETKVASEPAAATAKPKAKATPKAAASAPKNGATAARAKANDDATPRRKRDDTVTPVKTMARAARKRVKVKVEAAAST